MKLTSSWVGLPEPVVDRYPCNQDGRCPGAEWDGVWVHYLNNGDVPGRNESSPPVRNLWVNGQRIARTSAPGTALGKLTSTTEGYTFTDALPSAFDVGVRHSLCFSTALPRLCVRKLAWASG